MFLVNIYIHTVKEISLYVQGDKPSIAAIVGSMDPKVSTYECEVRIQKRENNEEIIQDMKEVTKSLLQKFYKKTVFNQYFDFLLPRP